MPTTPFLYAPPRLAKLMPSGPIAVGKNYTIVGRLQRTGDRKTQPSAMWLFSYDEL